MHNYGEGLKKGAFGERDVVRQFVAPFRRVRLVALNRSVVGVNTRELYIFAKVVAAIHAEEAFAARDSGLNCNAIT